MLISLTGCLTWVVSLLPRLISRCVARDLMAFVFNSLMWTGPLPSRVMDPSFLVAPGVFGCYLLTEGCWVGAIAHYFMERT